MVAARLEGRPIAKIDPIQPPKKAETDPVQAKVDPRKTDVKGAVTEKGKTEFNPMWIVYGAGGLLLLIILISMMRGKSRGPAPPDHPVVGVVQERDRDVRGQPQFDGLLIE